MLAHALNLWRFARGIGGGDSTPGGTTDVILLAGTTNSGIQLSGNAGYIKVAG